LSADVDSGQTKHCCQVCWLLLANNGTNAKQLAPNGSCTIQVQFNPLSAGVINATLTVTGPGQQSVTLTGTGN